MKSIYLLILLFFMAISATAKTSGTKLQFIPTFTDQEVQSEMIKIYQQGQPCKNKPSENFWKPLYVETNDFVDIHGVTKKYKLRFGKFGCGLGKHGALVIAPGRTEPSIEYYETALDYVKHGFSPVYVIDHRGQGLSPRLLENPHKGHLEMFTDFIDDFDIAVDTIVADLKDKEGRVDEPLFLTTNSLGGAIAVGYLQKKGDDSPFKATAILGAMIQVNYLSFVDAEPTLKNKLLYQETVVSLRAKAACHSGNCEGYANKKDQEAVYYNEDTRKFVEGDERIMTQSEARFGLRTCLWSKKNSCFDWDSFIQSNYSADEHFPGPQLIGATFSWAGEGARFTRGMRRKKRIRKMPSNLKLLVLTGTRDLRAYTPHEDKEPDLDNHENFCKKINRYKGDGSCTFSPLVGAFHEIYKEKAEFRNEGFQRVLDFFLQ